MQRVAIYIRVSTIGQAKEGDSIPAQREALLAYIHDRPDLALAGEYMDDGVSGQKYKERDELQRMLEDVKGGKIDLILVTKMDRLHRSLKHFLDMQEILDRYGVKWLAIWEPMYDTTTPQGQLVINQMMSIAQFEAQNTGARIRAVMEYKISQGEAVTGATPPGYSIVDKHLIPNELAPTVRAAFEAYSRCGNLCETMRQFIGVDGLPTLHRSFKQMLQNRKYIGEHRGNANYCPPIIDKTLFDDVQRKLEINVKKSQKYYYVFSGLLICGRCGKKLSACCRNNKGGNKRNYYRCRFHYFPPYNCDNNKHVAEPTLEQYLLDNIKPLIQSYVYDCQAKAAPVIDNRKKIATLERKIERLKELYINDLITIDEYKADKEKYLGEIATLNAVEAPEPVDTSALEEILALDIESYYSRLDAEKRRFFWRSIIREIVYTPGEGYRVVFL